MHLLLLGATGRTGRLVVEQALSRGHEIAAVVRDPAALPAQPRLHVARADPLDANQLARNLASNEVVISCLGQKSSADAHLLERAAAATLEAMARAGVHRLLVVSQGLLFPSRHPVIRLLRLILARHVTDSVAMEQRVRASDVDWTIVRPPRLLEGGGARGYRIKIGAQPKGPWSMQRIDLAAYLLDEAENGAHKKDIVGVTSA